MTHWLNSLIWNRKQVRLRDHPLAGRSKSTTFPVKRIFFFPLVPSRTVRDLSVTRPCFLFMRCRTLVRTSNPSGSKPWEISKKRTLPPLASSLAPEKLSGRTVITLQVTDNHRRVCRARFHAREDVRFSSPSTIIFLLTSRT